MNAGSIVHPGHSLSLDCSTGQTDLVNCDIHLHVQRTQHKLTRSYYTQQICLPPVTNMPGALCTQDRVWTWAAVLGGRKVVMTDLVVTSTSRTPLCLLATSRYSVDSGSHASAMTGSISSSSSSSGARMCLAALEPGDRDEDGIKAWLSNKILLTSPRPEHATHRKGVQSDAE